MSAEQKNMVEMEQTLKDITDCCICLETYRKPKILPCIHTFCLNCLEEASVKTKRCPGERMPCPICRKEFTIPEEGFSGLQKNFFMDRLVEIRKLLTPSVASILCDLCSEESDPDDVCDILSAEMYCIDCHLKLCQECCKHHRKSKLSKCHKIVAASQGQIFKEDSLESVLPAFCDQHESKSLEIYCSICQEVVCAICFFEFHKDHDGLHISNIVQDFREQIKKNTEDFPKYVTDLVKKTKTLEHDLAAFMQKTDDIEIKISTTRDDLKLLVDKHSECLLSQLRSLKQERLKDTEIKKGEIETLLASLESYETYCKQLTMIGSDSDICSAVTTLNKRSDELKQMYEATEQTGLQVKSISLRKAAILSSDDENIIGKIEDYNIWAPVEAQSRSSDSGPEISRSIACQTSHESDENCDNTKDPKTEDSKDGADSAKIEQLMEKTKEIEQQMKLMEQKEMEREHVAQRLKNYKPTPRKIKEITKTMASTGCVTVTGLTILDSELFITTRKNNDIEVYDSKSYAFKRLWRLSDLHDPWDICSCSLQKCLYIASGYNCSEDMRFEVKWDCCIRQKPNNFYGQMLKVNLMGNLQHSWYIGEDYGTLSITGEGNIIFTVPVQSKIVEYDANGECLREINISTDYNLQLLAKNRTLYLTLYRISSYIICPSHAEQLPTGNFLVTYFIFEGERDYARNSWRSVSMTKGYPFTECLYRRYSDVDGLCMIDGEGQMIDVFPGKSGSGFGELCEPWYLAVDKDMAVLVLERCNKRISLLNPNLEYKRKLISKKNGLCTPYRICLDESNGRILVANSGIANQQVLVYDIKNL